MPECFMILKFEFSRYFQYLKDLKSRGARVIIGEFFENAARKVMCEAYKLGMTQANGYVWFLPGWYQNNWYDLDVLRSKSKSNKSDNTYPDCSTAQMVEVIFAAFPKPPALSLRNLFPHTFFSRARSNGCA